MPNLSIKLKNFASNLLALKKNLAIVFYLGLLVLVGFEVWTVKTSVDQAMASLQVQPPSRTVQRVRINFTDYDAGVKKIQNGLNFSPNLHPAQNPFKGK